MGETLKDILRKDFWVNVRNETWLSETDIGKDSCECWSSQALMILKNKMPKQDFTPHFYEGELLKQHGLQGHKWLTTNIEGKIFISDGTAGQINSSFPVGFYGFLEEAPENLMRIYEQGKPTKFIGSYKDG